MVRAMPETIIVLIPSCSEHGGYPGNLMKVELPAKCECGGDRAVNMHKALSYDGSRRLNVDCWENSCGHIDTYHKVREGVREGRYKQVPFDTPTTLALRLKPLNDHE